jgi:CDP-diacylglycerol---glycerol-3-phosphate 3-phosphatidyltransferase
VNLLISFLDYARNRVRAVMRVLARGLNTTSRGKIHPNVITLTSFLAHIPIAWLIATTRFNLQSAILLLVFGLLDALDGEVARLQGRSSPAGMLLDATTDRMKEVILYIGVAAHIMHRAPVNNAVGLIDFDVFWGLLAVVAACGGSLLVSYVKAKGETAVASSSLDHAAVNRMFQDGLMRYEVRMAVLLIGLVSGKLCVAVVVIAVLAWMTAFGRLINISRALRVSS